jgi:hypothetical protein
MPQPLIVEVPVGWAELHDLLDLQPDTSTDHKIEVHCLAYKNPYTNVVYKLARYRTLRSGILGFDVYRLEPDGSSVELSFNHGVEFAEWRRLCLAP